MTSQPPSKDEIFNAAAEIEDSADRAAFLDHACTDDPELRAEIENLLRHDRDAGSFLQSMASPALGATVIPPQAAESPGTLIGPYKLLEQIGEGGFGIVYMADQQAPVRRRVALKIIKPGMDTKQVLARFEAERHALAMMDHPNIARALDAGATDSGRPYFVMELVRGVPITEYCDQNNLTVHERLDLFVTVCHAVQHAHQKGIIHRDIKPSNVLVTMHDGRAVPKVIDFGVAKAINQQLTQETIFTRFAEMIGTPLYMSPEQAEMTSLDIDTRSDIYSLGVLLYELLTGSTPFDKERLKHAAFDEIRRIIREEEPAKPSTRISTLGATSAAVAAHRHSNPHLLGRLMRGDLDWIVMKALEKDRTRRYETANGLAMDLQRHLADEPVLAGPPSVAYRFRKFARRNRAALAMIAVVTVALLLGIVGTTWQAIQATREREQAEANFQKARQAVDEYFTLVSESKLLDVPGMQPLRKDLLEAALRFYEKFAVERTNDPGVLADLAVTHLRVAVVYLTIGRTDDSLASLAQALDVIDRLRRDNPAATVHHRRLAGYWKGSRPAAAPTAPRDGLAALKVLERLVDTWQKLAEENPTEVGFQSDLAAIYAQLGQLLDYDRPEQAAIYLGKAEHILETLVRQHPKMPEYRADLAQVYETLIGTFGRLGRSADSESAFNRSLEHCEQLVTDFPNVPHYRLGLAMNLKQLGSRMMERDAEQAIAAYRRAIDQAKRLVTDFPAVPVYRGLLKEIANNLLDLARLPGAHQPEAERLFRELMVTVTQLAAENPEQTGQLWQSGTAFNNIELAKLLEKGGQPQEAEKALRLGIGLLEKLAAEHPEDRKSRELLAQSYQQIGLALSTAGRAEEAKKAFRQAADVAAKLASEFPDVALYRIELVKLLDKSGQPQEAEKALRKGLELAANDASAQHELGIALYDRGRLDEAEACFRKELELDPHKAWAHHELGRVHYARGRLDDAEACFRKEIELYPRREWSHHELGRILRDRGRLDEAEACFRKELEIVPRKCWSHHELGMVLSARGRLDDAEACFRKAIEIDPKHVWGHHELGRVHYARGQMAEAEACYRKAIDIDPRHFWSYFLLGDMLFAAGKVDEAVACYCKVVEINPQEEWAQRKCGQFLFDHGGPEEAEACFRKAIDIDPKHFWSHFLLGDMLFAAGKVDEAVDCYRKVVEINPQEEWAQRKCGQFLLDRGRTEEAEAYFRKVIETDPKVWPHLELGRVLHARGRLEEAEEAIRQGIGMIEKLAADHPDDRTSREFLEQSYNQIGWALSAAGRADEAKTAFRQAADVAAKLASEFPNIASFRSAHGHDLRLLAFNMSNTAEAQDKEKTFREAVQIFQQLATDYPNEPQYRHFWADTHRVLGRLFAADNRFDDAEKAYRQAIEIHEQCAAKFPGKPVNEGERAASYLDFAQLMSAVGRPEEGKDAYQKGLAITVIQKDAGSLNHVAWLLATHLDPKFRDPARAVELAKKAVELAPQAGSIWNTLGVAQYRAGDWKAAVAALRKSMELRNGGDSSDWFILGMCLWQQGEKDRARTWYKAARLFLAKHHPDNREYKRFRAEAAALMGLPETEPAEKTDDVALGEAFVAASPRASSYQWRGVAFANLEQWDRAADDFVKAIELGDTNYLAWYLRALARRAKDDKPGYQAACSDMLKQFAQTDAAQAAHFAAWTCALGPDAISDFTPAIALVNKAIVIDPKSAQFANCLGAILYRAGRFEEARQKLEETEPLAAADDPRSSPQLYTWYFLAMTHHRLGHVDEAKTWLDKARVQTEKLLAEPDSATAALTWNRRLTLKLLRREAEELLATPQTPATAKPQEDKTVK